MNDSPNNPIERDSCGDRTAERPAREPQFHVEWAIAVMIGLGVALGGAAVVALEQANRFPPEPSFEQGAKQWGTRKQKPEDSAAQTSVHELSKRGGDGGVMQDAGADDGQIDNTGEHQRAHDSVEP